MTNRTDVTYREWSRYQWAGGSPAPVEPDAPRWNLIEWVGATDRGRPTRPIHPAEMPEGQGGFSGFRHSPGGGSRWAEGYRH